MHRSTLIQADTHTWLVLREFPQHPKAIIHLMTDTTGDDRYILMTWHPEVARRRMVGIHPSLEQAEAAVPSGPRPHPRSPGCPLGRPQPDQPPPDQPPPDRPPPNRRRGTPRALGERYARHSDVQVRGEPRGGVPT